MKTLSILSLVTLLMYSCITVKPKDFTYRYDGKDTEISTLIDIDGYYIAQRECDSTFFSIFTFYPDGLFMIATTSHPDEIAECFSSDNQSTKCHYPLWGTYKIVGDTIKTQAIMDESAPMTTIFRNYLILSDKSLLNISDYVNPQNTKIGYMKNYPSFIQNPCATKTIFIKTENKRSSSSCPYLKKKWFNSQL